MNIEKLKTLLKQVEKIEEFDNRNIIFLPEEPFKALWEMKQAEVKLLLQQGHNEYYANGYKSIIGDFRQPSLNLA
jgi:hypothetical protein